MLFPTHVGVSDSRNRKAFTYLPAALIVLLVLLVIAVAVMMTRNRGESGGENDTTLPQITDGTTASLGGNTPIGKPPALTLPSAPEEFRRLTSNTGTYLNLPAQPSYQLDAAEGVTPSKSTWVKRTSSQALPKIQPQNCGRL